MNNATVSTRRQRLEERERVIVVAARTMFLKKGYDKATMLDIATLAGVAQGSIYLYFKNKQAVLGAVLGDFYNQLTIAARDGLRELSVSSTLERLRFLARNHMQHVIGDWQIIVLGVSLQRDQPDYAKSDAYQLNREYTMLFDDVVRDGIARDEVRDDVPVWVLRDQFFGALEYMVRTLILHNKESDRDEAIDSLLVSLQNGMNGANPKTTVSNTRKLQPLVSRLEAAVARLEAVS